MSALAGVWRAGLFAARADEQSQVEKMLARVPQRGSATAFSSGAGGCIGVRFAPARSDARACPEPGAVAAFAGEFAGGLRAASLAAALAPQLAALLESPAALADLDGVFAIAHIDQAGARLRLLVDPFGTRSLYYFRAQGCVYFATELAQLLALDECPRELDMPALHKYLTFSFVPGEGVPLAGIKRIRPGCVATFAGTADPAFAPYFTLEEREQAAYRDRTTAVDQLREVAKAAVSKRVAHGAPLGLYLSGGLDSSAMAVWLKSRETNTTFFTLDFGAQSVERTEAQQVAAALDNQHVLVPMQGGELASCIPLLAQALDMPFGDAVTGPQWLLGEAARAHGLHHVFNGEGGDQLFGGWTSKPMIAAEIYSGLGHAEEESREETYLRSYHRFYGAEDALYTDAFRAQVGGPGQRRAYLAPFLAGERGETFLSRVRLADISLKGSHNILPRAERIAANLGLAVSMPLFDRKLAEFSFHLPADMKLAGACEKFVLKIAMQGRLPEEIIWRKKSGMSVPITDWLLGPLREIMEAYIGDAAVKARGWFRPEYVANLRAGSDKPTEPRKRRVGEKLWTLLMLEAWMRHVVEGKSP